MKIKKGDNVIIISGKDRGKTGKVSRVFPKRSMLLIENANIRKRHQKPRKAGAKGQILSIATPLHASNVMVVDSKTGKRTRVGMKMVDGKKVRIAKKSGMTI